MHETEGGIYNRCASPRRRAVRERVSNRESEIGVVWQTGADGRPGCVLDYETENNGKRGVVDNITQKPKASPGQPPVGSPVIKLEKRRLRSTVTLPARDFGCFRVADTSLRSQVQVGKCHLQVFECTYIS